MRQFGFREFCVPVNPDGQNDQRPSPRRARNACVRLHDMEASSGRAGSLQFHLVFFPTA